MIQYILECIAFQLVFLMIYDFFLKRETFFQGNRFYLIGTYLVSLVLPLIKIDTFTAIIPEQYYYTRPQFLFQLDEVTVTGDGSQNWLAGISWEQGLLFIGMLLAFLLFASKLYKIWKLRKEGKIAFFPKYTRIVIAKSDLAFSFFKSIFLGDQVIEKQHQNIIAHELVHMKQRHTLDLLFFELMRILNWYNPLVYIYQKRISELHEFIADAKVAKNNRQAQYQSLLAHVFQTENISFINQFFNSSLTKKRIVMLQKSRSKSIWKFKYLLIVPLVMGMLFYSSCEREEEQNTDTQLLSKIEQLRDEIKAKEALSEKEIVELTNMLNSIRPKVDGLSIKDDKFLSSKGEMKINSSINEAQSKYLELLMDRNRSEVYTIDKGPIIDYLELELKKLKGETQIKSTNEVAFTKIDEVPVFPGCEEAADPRACFNEKIQEHIRKHFNYPQEAQEKGIQGKVYVRFVIGTDGSITDIKKRGPDPILEAEVERIISRLPRMTPGMQGGEPTNVPFSLPVVFKLK